MPGKNLVIRIWNVLKSIKAAVALILLIISVVTVDVLLLAKRWNPDIIYTGGPIEGIHNNLWFQVLVLLLLINLSACTADSLARRLGAGRITQRGLGSLVFHAGLIIILAGTLISGNFRVLGTITLIQGEAKQIPYRAITSRSDNVSSGGPQFSLILKKQRIETDEWENIEEIYSTVFLSDSGRVGSEHELAEQEKVTYRGLYMFPSYYGYAVSLEVEGPGETSAGSFSIPMETTEYGDGIKAYHKDAFRFDSLPYMFSFKFYPDLGAGNADNGRLINRSQVLGNPGLLISVQDKGSSLIQKIIRPGESITTGDYRIVFRAAKPWTQLTSVYDPGVKPVFAGIILSMTGISFMALYSKPQI